jgi:hypothetical protein
MLIMLRVLGFVPRSKAELLTRQGLWTRGLISDMSFTRSMDIRSDMELGTTSHPSACLLQEKKEARDTDLGA